MNLGEYYEYLGEILEASPENKKLRVVSASDDEGNYFHPIVFAPSLGHYKDNEFLSTLDEDFEDEGYTVNAVCLN
jgi:hypothetical protein